MSMAGSMAPCPRGQVTQPPLHRPGLVQDITGQLERQVLG
jgi:hypothetical protein